MNNSALSANIEDRRESGFVDVHGRDVKVIICEKTGNILIPLDEVRQTGFTLFRKSQYSKLLIDDKVFSNEFNLHLLAAAKSYLVDNRHAFNEHEILQSIDNCKKILLGAKGNAPPPNTFLKERVVQETDDDNIRITATKFGKSTTGNKDTLTVQNVRAHNQFVAKPDNTAAIGGQVLNGLNTANLEESRRHQDSLSQSESTANRNFNATSGGLRPAQNYSQGGRAGSSAGGGRSSNQSNQLRAPRTEPIEHLSTKEKPTGFNEEKRENFRSSRPQNNSRQPPNARESFGGPREGSGGGGGGSLGSRGSDISTVGGGQREQRPRMHVNTENTVKLTLKQEYEVMVTFVEKPNCIWVQDKSNLNILADIFNKVDKEQSTQDDTEINHSMHGKICLAQDEGLWFRCRVCSITPPKVFFVDYGNTVETDKVKLLSDDLAKIPHQAIRVAIKETDNYTPNAEDELRIQAFRQFEDGTYIINIMEVLKSENGQQQQQTVEKPLPPTERKHDSSAISVRSEPQQKQQPRQTFHQMPRTLATLENGVPVIIIKENNGKFTLRTKECCMKIKQIEIDLAKGTGDEPLQNVRIGQIVVCRKPSSAGQPHQPPVRAIVTRVTNNNEVHVNCFDYDREEIVPCNKLYHITERLASEPVTCFKSPTLKGYVEDGCIEGYKEFISEAIKDRTKFHVVLGSGNNFDLKLPNGDLLSEQISAMAGDSGATDNKNRVMYDDLQVYTPELNEESLFFCYTYKNVDDVTILPADEQSIANLDLVIRMDEPGTEPYCPIKGEVCFGFTQADGSGCWYRCKILECKGDTYEVLFFDFGNSETLRSNQLRKFTDDVKDIPILGLPSKFVDIKRNNETEAILKENITDGADFNVIVKRRTAGKFEIVIPALYTKYNLNN